ncbi:MAG: hypothetical protein EPGJADBJ_00135 [Saprospiraceae bacterium]|nr:hypothetical protein [Saprospiraceae bacterium]
MKVKNNSLIRILPALFVLALNLPANAQDDLYYDPSTDNKPVPKYEETYDEPNNVTRRYDGDDEYYEEDDYAYEYSSRIRRFHRPAYGVDYYDPLFVDLYYYDPFFLPGASIYTYGYNDYWRWRRWQRWQRWNAWNPYNPWGNYGFGWNSWTGWSVGFGGYGGWNAWNNPYVWNNYYYDPYWTWNGCNPYYGNVWVNNNYYYNNNNGGYNGHRPQTYTGPRRGGTTINNGYARLNNGTGNNGRLVAIDKEAPVIEISRPNGRTNIEKAPTGKPIERTTPTESRKPSGVAKDPNTIEGRNPAGRDVEKARPSRESTPNNDATPSRRPSRDTETRPSRQPSQETRPSRQEETRPSRDVETRPSRQPSQETRPSRNTETRPSRSERGNNEAARPSRPSSEDRPSRNIESRPSRSNDSGGRSWDSGSSGRSSSGNSGSSGGSRGSSGGGSKSSGGGSRGRN